MAARLSVVIQILLCLKSNITILNEEFKKINSNINIEMSKTMKVGNQYFEITSRRS